MGYDMNFVTPDEAEQAAVELARKAFYEASEARNALPRDTAESEAAQLVVDERYEALRNAEKSYFRANIWTMSEFRTVMLRLGMVDSDYRHAEFPADGWDEETGEPNAEAEAVLRGYNEFDGRIVLSKFGSNDGWIVTPDEIKSSLAQFDSYDDPRKAVRSALGGSDPEVMVDYFAKFVEWMRAAADHGGFEVH